MNPEEQTHEQIEASEAERKPGFWRRMFGAGSSGEEQLELEDEVTELADHSEESPLHNKPRKPRQTIFDRADEEQRRRYSQAAMVRRERLASAIGDRVEKVILERMEPGEQQLASVAGSFQEVRGLLGAIGRNLDTHGERTDRIAEVLEQMPEASVREQKILTQIARSLDGQSNTARSLAQTVQEVPQLYNLAKAGQEAAQERLQALHEVKSELAQQRDQRERMISTLRESTQRCENRLGKLEEAILSQSVQARNDSEAMRQSLEDHSERLLQQGREETQREDSRNLALAQSLRQVSRQLQQGNALNQAAVTRQGETVNVFHDSHRELLDALQRAQNGTVAEMQRIQEEVQDRAASMAWRNRLTLVVSASAIALLCSLVLRQEASPPPLNPVVIEQAASSPTAIPASIEVEESKTLPAGFPSSRAKDEGGYAGE